MGMFNIIYKRKIIVISICIILGVILSLILPNYIKITEAAPPSNTTSGTAIDITSLPYTNTQDVHDAGTTHEVWYKYTAQAGEKLLLIWGYGDGLTPYTPRIRAYRDAGTTLLVDSGTGSGAGQDGEQKPIQVGIEAGVTYYFRFTSNAGNPTPAILNVEAEIAPTTLLANGDLFINDDTARSYSGSYHGLPGIIVDPATGLVKNSFNGLPAGEGGDILADGTILVSDAWNGKLQLFDNDFNLITDVAFDMGFDISLRANHTENVFYVGEGGGGGASVTTVDSSGNLGPTTWDLGATGLGGIAASNDGSILYWADRDVGTPLRRHDLGTDTPMADLVAAVPTYYTSDILVLSDDTLIVLYHTSNGSDAFVRAYDAAGATIRTYNLGAIGLPAFTPPRLAYDVDLEANFWVWTHRIAPNLGMSQFFQVQVSDGTILETVDTVEFESGVYQLAASLTPVARAGISFSCPFFILRGYADPVYDLVVEKTVDDATPDEDQSIVYTITVTNNGPDDATDIEVTDTLPSEVTYVSHIASQGTYNMTTWLVGNLNNGESATLAITVTVDSDTAGVPFNNTATISTPSDSDATDNTDTTTITSVEPPPPPPTPSSSGSRAGDSIRILPAIGIYKIPNPLALPLGRGLIIYNYTVWNVGGIRPLVDVTLADDMCPSVVMLSGDSNNNNKLDPAESWQYSCIAILSSTTINTATATGYSDDPSHQRATATAIAAVIVGISTTTPALISTPTFPNSGLPPE